MRPDQLERQLRQRLDALGPGPRAEPLNLLILPDFDRADRIGQFWGYRRSRFAELLVDREEDRTLRARLVGVLREPDRRQPPAYLPLFLGNSSPCDGLARRSSEWSPSWRA